MMGPPGRQGDIGPQVGLRIFIIFGYVRCSMTATFMYIIHNIIYICIRVDYYKSI